MDWLKNIFYPKRGHNPPTYITTVNPGETHESTQTKSSERPVPSCAADLQEHRKQLFWSDNPVAVKFGAHLQDIHAQLAEGTISRVLHKAQCDAIREAAKVLSNVAAYDNEPEEAEEILDKVGLSGMRKVVFELTAEQYAAIDIDLDVQRNPVDGVYATRVREKEERQRAQHLLSRNIPVIPKADRAPAIVLDRNAPRTSARTWLKARAEITRGSRAEKVIAAYGLRNPEDVTEMLDYAGEIAAQGGPRAPLQVRALAAQDIDRGMDFNVVIQRLRVTHPLDCAQLLGHAGSAMRFGINRAMSTGYRNPNTGRASPMVLSYGVVLGARGHQ